MAENMDQKTDNSDENAIDQEVLQEQMNALGEKPGHEKVIDLIVKKDDVTWKTIILELVNSKRMDPWDIDIKLLTKEYLKIIKELKKHDFRISGKMILAAALLLKLKSSWLIEHDINALDQLFAGAQEEEDMLDMQDEVLPNSIRNIDTHKLIPKTPQPRKRKISIYDLVDALEKALEVKERRILRSMPSLELEIPKKRVDVSILMEHLFTKIEHLFSHNKNKVFFSDLVPGTTREDIVTTFIPLLHLDNSRRINIEQYHHFGPIEVQMNKNSEIQKELEAELKKEAKAE